MLMFSSKETGKKTQSACLIFHWITCSFWCENSVGNAYCFLCWKSRKISSLHVLYSCLITCCFVSEMVAMHADIF